MQILSYVQSGPLTVIFSGELNSLAWSGVAIASAVYNNASGYIQAEVEFRGASAQPYSTGGISVWFQRSVVSGTYEDALSGFVPARGADVFLDVVSGTIRTTKRCTLPPQTIQPVAVNFTGVSLASSGNIIRLYPLTFASVSG